MHLVCSDLFLESDLVNVYDLNIRLYVYPRLLEQERLQMPKAVPQTLFAQLGLVIEISMIGLAFACWLVLRVQPIGASY
jgi:hypothetical protein